MIPIKWTLLDLWFIGLPCQPPFYWGWDCLALVSALYKHSAVIEHCLLPSLPDFICS